jgi:altronate dehydratase small subunit
MKGETIDDAAIRMAAADNVVTALEDLPAGRAFDVDGETVTLAEPVEFGHKFALTSLESGDTVRKYGEVIGTATEPIAPGEWVHTHNVVSTRGQPGDDGDEADSDGGSEADPGDGGEAEGEV